MRMRGPRDRSINEHSERGARGFEERKYTNTFRAILRSLMNGLRKCVMKEALCSPLAPQPLCLFAVARSLGF